MCDSEMDMRWDGMMVRSWAFLRNCGENWRSKRCLCNAWGQNSNRWCIIFILECVNDEWYPFTRTNCLNTVSEGSIFGMFIDSRSDFSGSLPQPPLRNRCSFHEWPHRFMACRDDAYAKHFGGCLGMGFGEGIQNAGYPRFCSQALVPYVGTIVDCRE